jgi:cytidylate kinase
MPVITISRQLGSLGSQIARETADLLGYRLVWRDLINESALRAGAPGAALAVIDDLGLLRISLSRKEVRAYRKALQQVMQELFEESNVVIVGRAGQVILRGLPGVFHVRVIAPADLRAERIAAQQHISAKQATAQVEASDKNRKKFLKRFYKVNWADPKLYDLLINTAHLGPGESAKLIVQAVTQHSEATFEDQPE